ncbi:uncharacterized protein LOC107268467 [Cephus cinctus]|uniref:Uncharacterized protein LOC107268467 n=1 Tax=Cephus cinctus TaxID=211228 RepID=A0AAJ7RJC8_CEPCN|nr:uncharacterized protein LOC107268467 [Cephus cinctus]XP_024941669.1 uncharacterized protein LOC107268467 [Cephus cinctus]XP_024941672.1 uncharacterized protein LOC107268467 [Cephus cinctus]XP_024941674.1 uncharacterized protein LOC107268467 [Cephus cinctus]
MFSLRRNSCSQENLEGCDEFGWWLSEEVAATSPTRNTKSVRSSISTTSMVSCVDSEDPDNYSMAQEFTVKIENSINTEEIELKPLNYELATEMEDVNRKYEIRQDMTSDYQEYNKPQGTCYTPERLVRSEEYRILMPSPRRLSVPQTAATTPKDSPRKYHAHRRRLRYLIDTKTFGASHLEALLDPNAPEIKIPVNARSCQRGYSSRRNSTPVQDLLAIANRESPLGVQTPEPASSRSSYERLNEFWEDDDGNLILRSSQEDTSGIQSNDWSSDGPSESQTPLCLCDELATASRSFIVGTKSRKNVTAINEVVTILQGLEKNPDLAAILLDEDPLCQGFSGHDHLTRLALTIEPDGNVPTVQGDPDNVQQLRSKVHRLQIANKDIYKDICTLRRDIQDDEKRVSNLMSETSKLRNEVHDMRYMDDLLNLLRGELDRISRRNWPFALGHTERQTEEINLVV